MKFLDGNNMADYDITEAFKRIEDELIASMIRNMDRHRAEETDEGIQWSMWQTEQLKALEKYKKENQKKYKKQFTDINSQIKALITEARARGDMEQEIVILNAIKNGFKGAKKAGKGATAEFFKLNDRKLEALIEATIRDAERAETSVLRMADDQYRRIVFNAQVYANTGAGTYEKAVDMATKDFLAAGLNCVEYANGARHTIADYADMAIRTASKRAYLQGEGAKRQEWGITTVIMAKRGNPCPKCLPFVGKVLIDDVWSSGKKSDGKYPLMSTAIARGLYHPRCKDSHTTYFPGMTTADDTWTEEELEAIGETNRQEAKQQYAVRQAEKYGRLAKYSLDKENQKKYKTKEKTWKDVAGAEISDILKSAETKEAADMHLVGRIDRNIYKCITQDIRTDEVIITDNQIRHIKDRHPEALEKAIEDLGNAVRDPDYIIADDKHKNTGLVIKRIESTTGNLQLVLRICTSADAPDYKNSVISSWKISERRLQNYLRNKRILYKKE